MQTRQVHEHAAYLSGEYIAFWMSVVSLRKLEVLVDRMHLLCVKKPNADKSEGEIPATAGVGNVKPAVNNVDAVKNLVERACAGTRYKFSSLSVVNPSRVWGYGYEISYNECERDYSVYLKLNPLADGVEIDFWRVVGGNAYALIPFDRIDDDQIIALRDFFGSGFDFRPNISSLLKKAPRELLKER